MQLSSDGTRLLSPPPPPEIQPRRHLRWLTRALWLALPWALLLGLWSGIRLVDDKYSELVPSIHAVWQQAVALSADGTLAGHWLASTLRVTVGVLLGVAMAVPVGFVLGWYKQVRDSLTPLLNFFRALPPIALIPLTIVYFGIGETAKIVVLFYSAFFAAVIVMYEGISHISPIYLNVARSLGATDRELFTRVVVPLSLPHVLTATRVAFGIGWMTLVASELIAAQQGLGSMIQLAASYFQLDIIYLGLIVIGLTAMLMDFVLARISGRLLRWQDKVRA